MKATTCQMSNVCCAMCNVVVKAPNDLLTRRPNPRWENDFVIWSLGQWVLGQVHWTSHNRHSTFDKLWTPFIFSQLTTATVKPYFSPSSTRPSLIAGTVERMMFQPSLTRLAMSLPVFADIAHATLCVLQAAKTFCNPASTSAEPGRTPIERVRSLA